MSRVQRVTNYITNSNLSRTEMYAVHRHVGNLIQRRMYYQLIVTVPWEKESLYFDHTDRFEEVIEQLVKITLECINQEVCNIKALPETLFVLNKKKDTAIGIRKEAQDEQDICNIFCTFLGPDYKYVIEQHEVAFDFVDPYYR